MIKAKLIKERIKTLVSSLKFIISGNYVLITEDHGKVSINGMMPQQRLKSVIGAFNQQLNS